MLCYRKERLSSLYSEMHPTHPALAPYTCIALCAGIGLSGASLLFNVYCICVEVLSRRSCWLSRLSIALPHTRFVLSIAGVTIHHLLLSVLPHRMHLSLPVFVGLLYKLGLPFWDARVMLRPGLLPPELIVTTVRIGCPKLHFAHS